MLGAALLLWARPSSIVPMPDKVSMTMADGGAAAAASGQAGDEIS